MNIICYHDNIKNREGESFRSLFWRKHTKSLWECVAGNKLYKQRYGDF